MNKLLTLFLTLLTLTACTGSGVKEAAAFQFNDSPAWFWVLSYPESASEEEVFKFAQRWANPNKSSYFFAFPENSSKVSKYKTGRYSRKSFYQAIAKDQPPHSYLFMPNQEPQKDILFMIAE